MKTKILWYLLFLAVYGSGVLAALSTFPADAECAWCNRIACYNKIVCGSGCVCLKEGGSVVGRCVSLD